MDPTRGKTDPFALSQEPVTPEGERESGAPTPPAPAYEHLGDLPPTYGTQSVYLVAYDPQQLFVYWDVDWTVGPNTPYTLHVCRADGSMEQQVDIMAAEAGRYLPVQVPGGTYFVELGKYGRDGRWQVVATSTRATVPPAGLAGETEPSFATLPFHLSFQRLMELIHDAVHHGENLTAALARLQHGDQPGLSAIAGRLSELGPEPLQTLETLLGQKFEVSSVGDTSSPTGGGEGAGQPLHRDRHDVLSASAFSSESPSSANLSSGGGFGSSSEIGGARGLGGLGGSEALSSGAFSSGAFGGLGLGAGGENLSSGGLSSGALGGLGLGGENLSSGGFSSGVLSGAPGGGSETLAAYAAGLSSESLSSFGGGSELWHLASGTSSSGSGGFGGSWGEMSPHERTEVLLRALESHLGMLGGLFSDLSSGSRSGGF